MKNNNEKKDLNLKEILNYIIWDWFVIKNSSDDEHIVVEEYTEWKLDLRNVYSKDVKWLTNFIQEYFSEDLWYNKWWCDNYYVVKWSWHKLECDDWLNNVVRLIYEYQIEENQMSKEQKLEEINYMIKELEDFKKQIEEQN